MKTIQPSLLQEYNVYSLTAALLAVRPLLQLTLWAGDARTVTARVASTSTDLKAISSDEDVESCLRAAWVKTVEHCL